MSSFMCAHQRRQTGVWAMTFQRACERARLELPTIVCPACSLEMAPPDPGLHADVLDALGRALEASEISR